MKVKHWIIVALAGALTLSLVTVLAQEPPPEQPTPEPTTTANVEVRVWQSTRDALSLYISARPEGGSWATLGTIPLDMSGLNSRGTYRYGDITVGVEMQGVAPPAPVETPTPESTDGPAPPPEPAPEPESFTVNVEIRVWQSTRDARSLYISARPADGDWSVLGTIPLDMSGLNSRGTFRYGDITVQVPVPGAVSDPPVETTTPTPTPWVDPRPDNTYSLAELANMDAPAAPQPPPLPDHILALSVSPTTTSSMRVHLAPSSSSVTVSLTHTYKSREYPVTCERPQGLNNVECQYSESGPLNASGTARLSLFSATNYRRGGEWEGWPWPTGAYRFVSATLDQSQLTCTVRPSPDTHVYRLWWCYHPATYAAWERARDAALQPATDPLERYLRAEGDPPLWHQESPYSGDGGTTTGVMRIDSYINYDVAVTYDGDTMTVWARCAPIDPIDGSVSIHWDDLASGFLTTGFFMRADHLCEWVVNAEGEWTLSITRRE